jgi:hypothetical protein
LKKDLSVLPKLRGAAGQHKRRQTPVPPALSHAIRYTGAVGDRPVDPCLRPPEIAGTVDQEGMRQLELFAEHIIPAFR